MGDGKEERLVITLMPARGTLRVTEFGVPREVREKVGVRKPGVTKVDSITGHPIFQPLAPQ